MPEDMDVGGCESVRAVGSAPNAIPTEVTSLISVFLTLETFKEAQHAEKILELKAVISKDRQFVRSSWNNGRGKIYEAG